MIVGSYVLHLYCDFCQRPRRRNENGQQVRHDEFSGDSRQDSYRMARKAGWSLNERKGTAICDCCREEQ